MREKQFIYHGEQDLDKLTQFVGDKKVIIGGDESVQIYDRKNETRTRIRKGDTIVKDNQERIYKLILT